MFPQIIKLWQTDLDNEIAAGATVLACHQALLLAVKNVLVGFSANPWTVVGSCNSAQVWPVSPGLPTDCWTDAADLVWDADASAHSWIVLQNPARDTQVCIDCEDSGHTGLLLTIVWSPGGLFTGGSTTTRPTATDESVEMDGGTWAGYCTGVFKSWHHVWHSQDGSCTRVVLAQNEGDKPCALWVFDEVVPLFSGWSHPELVWIECSSGPSNDVGAIGTWAECSVNHGHVYDSLDGLRGCQITSWALGNENTTANYLAVRGTLAMDSATKGYGMSPAIVSVYEGGGDCWAAGVLRDFWIGPDAVTTGTTFPNDESHRRLVAIGCLVLPWSGDSTVPLFGDTAPTAEADCYVVSSGGSTSEPEIGNFSPANGSSIEAADPIYFDVTDDSGTFRRVLVACEQGSATELVHDGSAFLAPYAALSSRANIPGGYRYTVRRYGGWDDDVTIRIWAIDQQGNEAEE